MIFESDGEHWNEGDRQWLCVYMSCMYVNVSVSINVRVIISVSIGVSMKVSVLQLLVGPTG